MNGTATIFKPVCFVNCFTTSINLPDGDIWYTRMYGSLIPTLLAALLQLSLSISKVGSTVTLASTPNKSFRMSEPEVSLTL